MFPDPHTANEDGIVGIGGDLHPQTLQAAYRAGIFPWPMEGFDRIPWFCPEERGVLFFEDLHIPRSLKRVQEKSNYRYSINEDFNSVIDACAKIKRGSGTWITSEMLAAYKLLHKLELAHSVEVWELQCGGLIGGLYGVAVDGVFSGESMFSRKPNTSKLALLHLIQHLKSKGSAFIDIQMVTAHMKVLGGRTLPRTEYLALLKASQIPDAVLF